LNGIIKRPTIARQKKHDTKFLFTNAEIDNVHFDMAWLAITLQLWCDS
jgi:hypothetical protein